MTSGTTPKMKASDVIRIGRSRRRAASTAAAPAIAAQILELLGKLDDQDRILRREPISTMKPTWVRMLLSCPRSTTPVIEAMRHIGHDEDHRKWQRHALVLGGQHQEHEHHRKHEGKDRSVARPQLLEGKRRPLIAEAIGQRLGGELLHDLDGLALRVAGRRAPSSSAAG